MKNSSQNICIKATFQKEERLTGKIFIDNLFSKGKYFIVPTIKVVYLEQHFESDFPAKIIISVPKRNFKKAVDRNRIKRLIREVYRKNKHDFYQKLIQKNIKLTLGFVYTGNDLPMYSEIESKIILLLQKIIDKI